jgi:hypothetical protein
LFYWFDKADIAVLVDIKVAAGAVWAVTRAVGAAAVIAGAAANAAGATSTVAIEGISSSVFFFDFILRLIWIYIVLDFHKTCFLTDKLKL